MISFLDFQGQSFSKQITLLHEFGSCVLSIRYYRHKVNLYLLGDFYLEVFYHPKKDLIEKIVPLDLQHPRINFYTDQIRLPAIL